MQRFLQYAALVAAVSAPCLAQVSDNEAQTLSTSGFASPLEVRDALSTWQSQNGDNWRSVFAGDTGYGRFLYGGSVPAPFTPKNDGDFEALGRISIGGAYDIMGLSPAKLELDSVTFLPLGLIGTTDKTSVQFQQVVGGVKVERGFVNTLFNQQGQLLSIDTVGLPDSALPTSVVPTISSDSALAFARQSFALSTELEAIDIDERGLVIAQDESGKLRTGALAWKIRVGNESEAGNPQAFLYSISAQGELRVIREANEIHYFDVGGTVQTLVTPGETPDTASNPPVAMPAGYMEVTSSAGTVVTDAFGNFNFPGATGPLNVTFSYKGTYNNVQNDVGGQYSSTVSLGTGTGNSVVLNSPAAAFVTSQSTTFSAINRMRDWTRATNPFDAVSDFNAPAFVNINDSCNAFFNGFSTNYFQAGGGCAATSFDNVVWHEMGHWMNVRYGSGNGPDGFGEGNADVFAMYQANSPNVGDGFCGPGCSIRTGLNTRTFCGDNNTGCYGQVHADGEVLMGALWKVRAQLQLTYGEVPGGLYADQLFNSWMNAYNDGQIKSIIENHWLVLDDNDGNIANGTPSFPAINAGFLAQGFPGFEISILDIASVVEPGDTQDQSGPYGVSAVVTPVSGVSIASATLSYRVNGGTFQNVAMLNASGDRWFAPIPGQTSPNKVEWFLTAQNNLGESATYPKAAPTELNKFEIGTLDVFYFEDFEGNNDAGWTHAQVNEQDDWQRGAPQGAAGDPSSAFSGSNVWANDLGGTGFNGEYKPNVENFLRSPNISLSGASGSKLVYQRWLTVEEGIFDNAEISVNGNLIWNNPANGNLIDSSWTKHELDLAAFDGQSIQVEYRLRSDGGLEFGGWNIDDFGIQSLNPSPTAGLPVNYGSGTLGFTAPSIDSLGQVASLGNSAFAVAMKDGPAEAMVFFGIGIVEINTPVLGVDLLVSPTKILQGTTDLFGQYSVGLPVPSDPAFIGVQFLFQAIVEDAGATGGFAASNGLRVTIQP
ncbi:MAG: hypothetical protein ACI9D0_000260 [Bacteroidia bacterium]|jgi:hypothetical protein